MSDELLLYLAFLLVLLLFVLVFDIARRVLWGVVFRRCGEPMWKAWVPGVDMWTIFTCARMPGWLGLVVFLVSLFGVSLALLVQFLELDPAIGLFLMLFALPIIIALTIVAYVAMYRITKRLGHDGAYIVLALLLGELVWLILVVTMKPETASAPSAAQLDKPVV